MYIFTLWFPFSFTVSFVYCALTLSAGDLGSNPYLTFFIFGAIEIPSGLLAQWAMTRWSRRSLLCISSVTMAVCMFCLPAVPQGERRSGLRDVGSKY